MQDNNYISPSRPTNLPRRSPLKNSIRKPSPRIGMHRDNRGGYSIRTPQRDQRSNNRGDDRRIVPLGERPIRGDDRRITPLEERQTRDDRGNFRDNRGDFRDDRRDLRNDRKDFRDERKNENPSFRSIRRNPPSHFPGGRFERNQTFNNRLYHQRDFSKFNDPPDDGHIRGRVSDVSMKSCTPFKNEPPPSFNGSFKNTQDNPHNPFNRSSQESSNPFAQNNAHDNPFKRSNTTVVNPYSKGDPLGVAFAGNTTKWEKSLREGVFDRKLTTHPTTTNQFVLKKPEVIKLGLPKPPSSFAMPLKQPKTNPFSDANYKPDIPDNPFTKKRAEKENTSFNRQQPIFKKETPVAPQRPVLRQMPVQNILPPQDLDSQEVPQYHDEEKSRGALISEVLDYFLHSDVAEVLGGSTSPHTKSNVKQNEVYQLVIKPLELAFLRDIPVNDCFTELYEKNRGHDVQLYFRRN